jgi:hypothetical protein
MKSLLFSFPLLLLLSCSYIHRGNLSSCSQTQISLSGPNYKILGSVCGFAEEGYFLFIPTGSQNLFQRARENMFEKANVYGFPKAIINITTDFSQIGFFPIYYKERCYLSGEVITFVSVDVKQVPIDTSGLSLKNDFEVNLKNGQFVSGTIEMKNDSYFVIADSSGGKYVIKFSDVNSYKKK